MGVSRISEAEMKVMGKIWKSEEMISISNVVAQLKEDGEEWAYQTVSTFLARLEEKGFVASTKNGNKRMYYPLVSREQYNSMEATNFVDNKFGGSLRNFLAAFSGNARIKENDINELKEWMKKFDN